MGEGGLVMIKLSVQALAGLLCAVNWQTPDGVLHTGAYVYPEADAQALAAAQATSYPTYTFSVVCKAE